MEYYGSINKDIYVSGSYPFAVTNSEIKNLNDKVDAIQRSLSTLTHLVSRLTSMLEKNLEERRYAAIRERERRW